MTQARGLLVSKPREDQRWGYRSKPAFDPPADIERGDTARVDVRFGSKAGIGRGAIG